MLLMPMLNGDDSVVDYAVAIAVDYNNAIVNGAAIVVDSTAVDNVVVHVVVDCCCSCCC